MKPMIMTKCAIDTNILIYCHSDDELDKQAKARFLVNEAPTVSTQVLSEYFNVMKKKFPFTKKQIFDVCIANVELCPIQPITLSTLHLAKRLIDSYDFQLFDSIVVASALEAGCDTLYSEDFANNMVVEKYLTIINPF